jgi:hypothetical protein
LSIALNGRGQVATHCGDFETAASLAAEKDVVNEVTGIRLAATCDLLLAGYRAGPRKRNRFSRRPLRTRRHAARDSPSR